MVECLTYDQIDNLIDNIGTWIMVLIIFGALFWKDHKK